jgi:hypothetical protein
MGVARPVDNDGTSTDIILVFSTFRVARVVAFVSVLSMPVLAMAASTSQGIQMMRNWKASDHCVAAAQKQLPDYTEEWLKRRDAALQQCLASQNLPPRAPAARAQAVSLLARTKGSQPTLRS